jgi:hypothetical protein
MGRPKLVAVMARPATARPMHSAQASLGDSSPVQHRQACRLAMYHHQQHQCPAVSREEAPPAAMGRKGLLTASMSTS